MYDGFQIYKFDMKWDLLDSDTSEPFDRSPTPEYKLPV